MICVICIQHPVQQCELRFVSTALIWPGEALTPYAERLFVPIGRVHGAGQWVRMGGVWVDWAGGPKATH